MMGMMMMMMMMGMMGMMGMMMVEFSKKKHLYKHFDK
jgi:hypothetical protein